MQIAARHEPSKEGGKGGLILRCHKFRVSEESLFGGNALLTHPARKGCVERASSLRGERFFRHDEMTVLPVPIMPCLQDAYCKWRWHQNEGTSYLTGYINITLPSAIAMSEHLSALLFAALRKNATGPSVRPPAAAAVARAAVIGDETHSSLGRRKEEPDDRRGPLARSGW